MSHPVGIAAAVDDALDGITAHHHALFLTFLELLTDGVTPLDAVEELSRRSGEDCIYLCRVMIDELTRNHRGN